MSDRVQYKCPDCGITILIDSPDPQAIGRVYCDCTAEMDINRWEE